MCVSCCKLCLFCCTFLRLSHDDESSKGKISYSPLNLFKTSVLIHKVTHAKGYEIHQCNEHAIKSVRQLHEKPILCKRRCHMMTFLFLYSDPVHVCVSMVKTVNRTVSIWLFVCCVYVCVCLYYGEFVASVHHISTLGLYNVYQLRMTKIQFIPIEFCERIKIRCTRMDNVCQGRSANIFFIHGILPIPGRFFLSHLSYTFNFMKVYRLFLEILAKTKNNLKM